MRPITVAIILIILILNTGCFATREFTGKKPGLLENVKTIALKDSTMIFISSPVRIRIDKEKNNLIIRSGKKSKIEIIPVARVSTVYSKHFSLGYALRARLSRR